MNSIPSRARLSSTDGWMLAAPDPPPKFAFDAMNTASRSGAALRPSQVSERPSV